MTRSSNGVRRKRHLMVFGSRYTRNRGLEAGSLIATGNKYCVEKLSVVEELEVSRRAEQERGGVREFT